MLAVETKGLMFRITEGAFTGRQSSIRTYKNCHRLYGWERVENLALDRPAWNLEFGSAAHLFLQEYGRGQSVAKSLALAEARLLRDLPKALLPDDLEEQERHRELLRTLMPAYVAYWQDDAQFIPLGQEVKGRVEVGNGSGVFLVFTLDRIGFFLDQLWIKDYKTMSKNDDRNFERFEMDLQPTAYVYGASKVLKKRVAGIIIDGLIKTKTPQFRREMYLRTDAELLEFENEFVEVCSEIAWRHVRVQNGEDWKTVFWKNESSCMHQYGSKCPFLTLCQRDSIGTRALYKPRDVDYMDRPEILTEGGNE